jgi:CoA:oxalate CoA-transferase
MSALSRFRVIDMTHVLAGPFCTKMLADLGADVIKIERPHIGDDSRSFGPFVNGESVYFIEQNRNKRSVVLDLKTQEGLEVLLYLIKDADVLVENYRPGVMESFGLGYENIKEINPSLIFASCSGFGANGSRKESAAYDATIQAISGIMGVTGKADGEYSKVGPPAVSTMTGLFLAMGILAALYERGSSGLGQKVDVSMYDSAVAIMENPMVRYLNAGIVPKPLGNRNAVACPFSAFRVADGDIVIATTTDQAWFRLCEAMSRAELTEDPRFVTMENRASNWIYLEAIMNEILGTKTMAEWIRILREHNVVCGTISTMKSLLSDPQIADRNMILDLEHPVAGRVKVTGMPIKLSRTPCTIRRSAPLLGENSEEILADIEKI